MIVLGRGHNFDLLNDLAFQIVVSWISIRLKLIVTLIHVDTEGLGAFGDETTANIWELIVASISSGMRHRGVLQVGLYDKFGVTRVVEGVAIQVRDHIIFFILVRLLNSMLSRVVVTSFSIGGAFMECNSILVHVWLIESSCLVDLIVSSAGKNIPAIWGCKFSVSWHFESIRI